MKFIDNYIKENFFTTDITKSEDKWKLQNGLVLMLPHGYEGLGYVFSHFKLLRSDYVGLTIVESVFYTILYFTNGVIRYLKFI